MNSGITQKKGLLSAATLVCGALGFALLMWTPKSGRGILAYVALFVILAITALILFPRNRGRDS